MNEDRYKDIVPAARRGCVYAVYNTESEHPDRPQAVFGFPDRAEEWARQMYGRTDGRRWRVPDTIQVRAVDGLDGDVG